MHVDTADQETAAAGPPADQSNCILVCSVGRCEPWIRRFEVLSGADSVCALRDKRRPSVSGPRRVP
jgi:hypothetical protein